jgi:hypothetical protein
MKHSDVRDAAPIVLHVLKNLAACIPASGVSGSQARAALGDLSVNAATLLTTDALAAAG